MEYRGKQYRAVQGIDKKWKWSVDFDGRTASGRVPNRQAAVKAAERAIDQALAPKKKRLIRPTK
jgi:hypothetical protein